MIKKAPEDINVEEINTPKEYMVEKKYDIVIEDKNVNKIVNDLIAQSNMLGGKFVSSSFETSQHGDTGYVVEVPVDKESKFLNYLNKYKIIKSSVSVIEVSKQYMSIQDEIELLNKKIELYQDYINTQKLSPDVTSSYYDKLFNLKSQLKYLKDKEDELQEQTSYSTFYIKIENTKVTSFGKLTINFSEIWFNIKKVWIELLVAIIYFVSIALPLIALIYVGYKKFAH